MRHAARQLPSWLIFDVRQKDHHSGYLSIILILVPSILSVENMRRIDRYCPAQGPYQKVSKLGPPHASTYAPYAVSIVADLKSRKRITLNESYYLYFLARVLHSLGLELVQADLEDATAHCEVIDRQKMYVAGSSPSVSIPGLENVKKVNWRFLPNPESLSPEEFLQILSDHFEKYAGHSNVKFEMSRIKFAFSLKPKDVFIGTEEFAGYYAFVFPENWVLFECPAYGNAAYIVRGDWRTLSQQYKAQLQRKGMRIVHGARTWRSRIRRAMKTQ